MPADAAGRWGDIGLRNILNRLKRGEMGTGENEQGLGKITDMTRFISITVLGLHCYYFCYSAFQRWGLTAALSDRLLLNIKNSGLFDSFSLSKTVALGFWVISLLGAKGKKEEKLRYKSGLAYIAAGILIYFGGGWLFGLGFEPAFLAIFISPLPSQGLYQYSREAPCCQGSSRPVLAVRMYSIKRMRRSRRRNVF